MIFWKISSSFIRLANSGNADSQFELAEFLGQYDEPDFELIAHWYRQAAEQGHREAQNNLGSLY